MQKLIYMAQYRLVTILALVSLPDRHQSTVSAILPLHPSATAFPGLKLEIAIQLDQ
jgi:hypothetical protein